MKDLYMLAGVSKQSHSQFYARESAFLSELTDLVIQVDLLRSFHPGCGLEKMYYTLKPTLMGRDKFIEIFMKLGYRVKKTLNHRRTTFSTSIYYPNFIEGALVIKPNRIWQTDITYFDANGRFYYLVFIIDIYTKLIVGYSASHHMRATANMNALNMAIKNAGDINGLIHHSDRGGQYVCKAYLKILNDNKIKPSMAQSAQDNAYAERVNGIIKNEYLNYKKITELKSLKKEVTKAVKHYNTKRIHNALPGKTTPTEFADKIVCLPYQKRPMVIVYAEANFKLRKASSLPEFIPETDLLEHVCPINY